MTASTRYIFSIACAFKGGRRIALQTGAVADDVGVQTRRPSWLPPEIIQRKPSSRYGVRAERNRHYDAPPPYQRRHRLRLLSKISFSGRPLLNNSPSWLCISINGLYQTNWRDELRAAYLIK
jgi:hypothetical protein